MQSCTHTVLYLYAIHIEIHTQTWQSRLSATHAWVHMLNQIVSGNIHHTHKQLSFVGKSCFCSLSLSLPLRLYWPLCSSRLHKAEPSGTTDKSWVISQAVCRWRGKNIKTIWYSYAQHLTHKHCLWAWRRHADIAEPMESHCETQGVAGKKWDLKRKRIEGNGWVNESQRQ